MLSDARLFNPGQSGFSPVTTKEGAGCAVRSWSVAKIRLRGYHIHDGTVLAHFQVLPCNRGHSNFQKGKMLSPSWKKPLNENCQWFSSVSCCSVLSDLKISCPLEWIKHPSLPTPPCLLGTCRAGLICGWMHCEGMSLLAMVQTHFHHPSHYTDFEGSPLWAKNVILIPCPSLSEDVCFFWHIFL